MHGSIENESSDADHHDHVPAEGMTAVTDSANEPARMAVPEIIRTAGDDAVRAYREFLADARLSAGTSRVYGGNIRRFFHWAQKRGLALTMIDVDHGAVYTASLSPTSARIAQSALRGVFGHLVAANVLAANPFPPRRRERHWKDGWGVDGPRIPLPELKRIVLKASAEDAWEEDSEDFHAGLVLLAPLSIGTMDPAAVAAFTGVPETLVKELAGRLIANGIWLSDGKIALSGDDNLAFMMDVWVALGQLKRGQSGESNASAPV